MESSCETVTAAALAWALALWLSSTEVPDRHYLETSALLLLSPPQTMTLPVHRPRWVKLVFWNSSDSVKHGWLTQIRLSHYSWARFGFLSLKTSSPFMWEFTPLGVTRLLWTCLFVQSHASVRRLLAVLRHLPGTMNGRGQSICSIWGFDIQQISDGNFSLSTVKTSTNTLPSSAACFVKSTQTWVGIAGVCVSTESERVFVCGFPQLNLHLGERGAGCGEAVSPDSGLLTYRWASESQVLTRKVDRVSRTTYCVLIWAVRFQTAPLGDAGAPGRWW